MSLFRDLLIEKKRKPYYCEVEYLHSNGSAFIKTGILANSDVVAKLAFKFDAGVVGYDKYVLGAAQSATRMYFGTYQSKWMYGYGAYTQADGIQDETFYDCEISWKAGNQNVKVNGTTVITGNRSEAITTNQEFYLFGRNNSGSPSTFTSTSSIYYCQIWQNGVLVRDLIPVLDWNYTPCMYDKISGQFFYNQGTGTFQYGREIHYVDYLESTGTQYIDTGIVGDLTTEINCEAAIVEAGNASVTNIMGNNVTSTRAITINMSANITNPSPSRIRFGNTDNTTVAGATNLNTFYKYNTNKDKLTVKDTNNNILNTYAFNATTAFTTNGNILIYKLGDTSTQYIGKIKVRSASIINNGTIVRNFIPAIDENGVGYMFDKITHTIYDNAGTGTFGYSAREVEYLESDGAGAIVAGVTVDNTCGYDVKWMALNADDRIILGTKGAGESRWVLSGSNNPNVNLSWNTSSGSTGLGLNKIQTAQMNYLNNRKRILNDIELTPITETLSSSASTYNVGIFGGYWGASSISLYSTCRIYYAKITKGTEFIRDFIPMIKDGSPCLFDKIGGLYYFGTGTGTFTTGKIVESRWF